jgi:hypothetical protein
MPTCWRSHWFEVTDAGLRRQCPAYADLREAGTRPGGMCGARSAHFRDENVLTFSHPGPGPVMRYHPPGEAGSTPAAPVCRRIVALTAPPDTTARPPGPTPPCYLLPITEPAHVTARQPGLTRYYSERCCGIPASRARTSVSRYLR